MYFGATEKWHVQMVMVSRVVQLAGASDAPPGTRVSNRGVYAGILVMPDVQIWSYGCSCIINQSQVNVVLHNGNNVRSQC